MEEEKDILRRVSGGDSDAFRLIFLKYAPRVEAFAMKMLKNIHEAQDVSQNIFTKLWMQRSELAGVRSLNAYLFRMTRNAVLDICKHSRIRMQFESSARVDGQILCDDVAERVDTAELTRLIAAAVSKMPARRYEIFRLSRECGKNNREIAEELNISPKSVENQITKALGRIENFRMFKNADGELCVWDKIVPNFTFFHPDDCTFSDCWTDFSEDFPTFYNAITADMQTYKDVKGIKTKPNQPANFYFVSCTPWTAFTGCGSRVADGQPAYFPIVVMGRYEKCGGKVNMPVNITIAHAVADGYHAGLFFRYLQEELDFLR